MRHLLDIDDLTAKELTDILDFSEQCVMPSPADGSTGISTDRAGGIVPVLKGKGVALFFEKPSLRTRHSMEMAVNHLGGSPITVAGSEIGIGTRESAADIASTMSQYHSAIGARVLSHQTILDLAAASEVPVFNLLSDLAHPFQALADLLTIRQEFKKLAGIKLAYIGDSNNVAHSLLLAADKSEMSFHTAHPEGYGFSYSEDMSDKKLPDHSSTHDPFEAVKDADVVYTDVWTSMGQESESKKREKIFQGYCVTEDLMTTAKPEAIFLHCLPAHRGSEVAAEVIDGSQSRVWHQAKNRMHTAMGFFLWLAENNFFKESGMRATAKRAAKKDGK